MSGRGYDWSKWNRSRSRSCRLGYWIFTALYGMQTPSSDQNSVCLSVCLSVRLSVKRVIYDKMEERSVQIFVSYEKLFSLVFWEEKWLVGATPSTWNFGSTGPRWNEIADFQLIFARSSSAVTPSEKKVQITLIGSSLRALRWAQDKHRTLSLSPPPPSKGGLKTQSVRNLNNKLR